MKHIAIHYGHNCTVGVLCDGKVECILSEERICRVKNATGYPFQVMDYIRCKYLGGDFANAGQIGIIDGLGHGASYLMRHGTCPGPYLDYYWKNKEKLWREHAANQQSAKGLSGFMRKLRSHSRNKSSTGATDHRAAVLQEVKLPTDKVRFLDHHTCHAASAACFSPVTDGDEWLVLTLDGEGDDLSASVSVFRLGAFQRLSTTSNQSSIGRLYAETTAYLGMKSNEHEFKLMGMAPYADERQVTRLVASLRTLMRVNAAGEFESAVPADQFLKALMPLYAFERFDVISGAIQQLTEELILQWSAFWMEKTGVRRLAVSGGVFMNVKAAKRLMDLPGLEDLFVVPSASDESLPIGALWLLAQERKETFTPVKDLYLGRGFDDYHVETMISRDALEKDFEITRFGTDAEMAERVSDLLAADEVVARCAGREEWGARALGNRSILCNPSNFGNIERLNSKVKCRDFWMPFTPSILEECLPQYIIAPLSIKAFYMALTFDSTPLAREHFAAAVHPRDFTMRPQAVSSTWNAPYHRIISGFRQKTGVGGLLNTSFNLHGEPNVSSPEDAVRTVRNSGLDYLLFEKILLKKKPA
jgi:carbamoyltransferase